jgi:hypothetical protein
MIRSISGDCEGLVYESDRTYKATALKKNDSIMLLDFDFGIGSVRLARVELNDVERRNLSCI